MSQPRKWAAILVDALIRGISVTEVAAEQGVSKPAVTSACRTWDVLLPRKLKNTGRLAHIDWHAEFLAAARSGETLDEFCKRLKVSTVTVRKREHEYGMKVRRKSERRAA